MFIRLAFSCAINVEPDILVVDEALAVGDAKFQLKCFRRLQDLKANGLTILFVSHATELVKSMCDSAIVLDKGHSVFIGESKTAAITYLQLLFPDQYEKDGAAAGRGLKGVTEAAHATDRLETERNKPEEFAEPASASVGKKVDAELSRFALTLNPETISENKFGAGGASIRKIVVQGLSPPNILNGGSEVTVVGNYRWDEEFVQKLVSIDGYERDITFGVGFSDSKGTYIFGCNGFDYGLQIDCLSREQATLRYSFSVPYLADGIYFMTAAVALGSKARHLQLAWYDCFVELRCESTAKAVNGLFAIDYVLEEIPSEVHE
jgi:lipopolysaccharide transport system ATP-binding protein